MRFTRLLRQAANTARALPAVQFQMLETSPHMFITFRYKPQGSNELAVEHIVVKDGEGNPTGLTNLYQHPAPRTTLIKIYDHTLRLLKELYPEHSIYRQSVEKLTQARKRIVEENDVIEAIEEKIGSGLIEEVIVQAAQEARLAYDLSKDEPWGELIRKSDPGQWKYFDRQ